MTTPFTILFQPLPITLTLLLILNDRLLKKILWIPMVLRGKISDFCGVFILPLFLFCLLRLIFRKADPRRILLAGIGLTLVFFTALKVSVFTSQPLTHILGKISRTLFNFDVSIVADPWDLTALIMLPLVYGYGRLFFNKKEGFRRSG